MNEYVNFGEQSFIDRIRLRVSAGDGGTGCFSFLRDKYVRIGPPNGGSGGRGGHIILQTNAKLSDLHHLRNKTIVGNPGRPGSSQNKDGSNGGDLKIQVPIGTIIYEITGEKPNSGEVSIKNSKKIYDKRFQIDLSEDNQEYIAAKGGSGSRGNGNNKYLKNLEQGKEGQRKDLWLELKCLADCGLVGFPNAGKSTFISSVSRQLPKIANYPFTTLTPTIGKINFIDDFSFTMADIPGIVEKSHKNKGLGLEFLRHIERTKLLIFLIDISGEKGQTPWEQLAILKNELHLYKEEFLGYPSIVVCNKIDLEPESERRIQQLREYTKDEVYGVSAKHGIGIGEVVLKCRAMIQDFKAQKVIID